MRFSLYLFLFSALLTHLSAAEYGSLYVPATSTADDFGSLVSDVITLNDGDQFEVIGFASSGDAYRLAARDQRAKYQDALFSLGSELKGMIIVGPCLVGIKQYASNPSSGADLRISYKLTRRPDPQTVSTPTAN
jgi:hypothetical protein